MNKEDKMEITVGSVYKISSLGTRDSVIETEGTFKGFIPIGVEETGLLMELSSTHGDKAGSIRIVPLHVILLIDILESKENDKKDDDKGMAHYVG